MLGFGDLQAGVARGIEAFGRTTRAGRIAASSPRLGPSPAEHMALVVWYWFLLPYAAGGPLGKKL